MSPSRQRVPAARSSTKSAKARVSCASPGVRTRASGRPRASRRRCSLVVNPPRERPSAWPSCPLGAGRALGGADDGAVQHLHALLGRATAGEGGEDRLEHARVAPAREAAPDRAPVPVPLRDRPPAGALARPPQDAVQDRPVLVSGPARSPALSRQQRPDQLPFRIRQIARSHTVPPLPKGKRTPAIDGGAVRPHGLIY